MARLYPQVKRAADTLAALAALAVLWPVFAGIALAILLDTGRPVFFHQERAGRNGKRFSILKFRTMIRGAESSGLFTSEDDPRITRVGRFLRRWSLDELPQLLNVLAGHMSLVGPRPTLPYQVERYDRRQRGRLLVRPGMTGLAQVRGRNALSWTEKVELDLEYIENMSPWLDLRIILATPPALTRGNLYRDAGEWESDVIAGVGRRGTWARR